MKKKILTFSLFFCLFFILPSPVYSLRPRERKSKEPKATNASFSSQGAKCQIRLRNDRRGLLINVADFKNAQSVAYEILYTANGLPQGIGGLINPEDTTTKDLYFGTCSSGVCTPHQKITNTRLSIITTLKNGIVILKPYRIKI